MKAVLSGDKAKATARLRQHIEQTQDNVRQALERENATLQ